MPGFGGDGDISKYECFRRLKMSKAFKAASSVGAVMVVLASGAAYAAAPGFNDWEVNGGTVTTNGGATCYAGYSCGKAITGDGFFQRQVTDTATGDDYFQTIITDKTATGSAGDAGITFSDESFVAMGNSNGIKDRSYIYDSRNTQDSGGVTVEEKFYAMTELNTGWAAPDASGDQTKIWQAVIADNVQANRDDFRTDFWFDQRASGTTVNSRVMRISEYVDIEKTTLSYQDFVLVDKVGTTYVNAGSVMDFKTSAGTTDHVIWEAGDNIKAVWVGQDLHDMADVYQEFGFTSYENLNDVDSPAKLIEGFSLSPAAASAPQGWDDQAVTSGGWGSYLGSQDGTGGPFTTPAW
jgi:hypothetical protein